jgi:hypothetical protein
MKFIIVKVLLLCYTFAMRIDENNSTNEEKKVPIINVYSELADRDPLDLKRDNDEKLLEDDRIRKLKEAELSDKVMFKGIIAKQKEIQAKLISIEEESNKILNKLLK